MSQPGQLCGDLVFAPERVLSPYPTDERAGVRVDGRSPNTVARSSCPDDSPERAVPAEHGFRPHDGDCLHGGREQPGDGGDGESVAGLQSRVGLASLQNDDLLTKHGVLGDQPGASAEQVFQRAKQGAYHFAKHRGRVPSKTSPASTDRSLSRAIHS